MAWSAPAPPKNASCSNWMDGAFSCDRRQYLGRKRPGPARVSPRFIFGATSSAKLSRSTARRRERSTLSWGTPRISWMIWLESLWSKTSCFSPKAIWALKLAKKLYEKGKKPILELRERLSGYLERCRRGRREFAHDNFRLNADLHGA